MAKRDPINIWGMGLKGVNLVKSPLHLDDSELTRAQNAEPFTTEGVAGIRQRPGLQRVVPTGPVAPGTVGGPFGLYVVDDDPGYPIHDGCVPYGLHYTCDDGVTYVTWSGLAALEPNKKYSLFTTDYDADITPLFPAVWLNGTYYFGGRVSGQVLSWSRVKDPTRGLAFGGDIRLSEVTRLAASGVIDDTLVCPGIYNTFGVDWLVISIIGGGVQLYQPETNTVKKLPALAATVTGSATWGGRLWVVSGLSLYSINPAIDAAWTTAATVADAGIAALTGLAVMGGFLFAGSRTSSINIVRVYKFAPVLDDGTAVASTSASVQQTVSPAYMYGPFPPMGAARMHVIYRGTAAAFVTLIGSLGNAEVMTGASWRILSYDPGTAGPWHNGADTNSDDLINVFWQGSTSRWPGPIVNVAGRYQMFMTHYDSTGDRLSLVTVLNGATGWVGAAASGLSGGTAASYKFPMMP